MKFTINFRALKLSDATFVNQLRQMEDMERLIGGAKRVVAYERDLKWINDIILGDDPKNIYFAVTPVNNDEIIGYTSISEIDYRNGSCFWSGIKLHPEHAGKGYGTQIALKVLKYVFEEMRMERCKGECLEQHEAVLKMLLKIGFVKEGLLRSTLFKNGIHNNQYVLSVLKNEYTGIKTKYGI